MPDLDGQVGRLLGSVQEEHGHFKTDNVAAGEVQHRMGALRHRFTEMVGLMHALNNKVEEVLGAYALEKESGGQLLGEIATHAELAGQVSTDANSLLEGSNSEHATNVKDSLREAKTEADNARINLTQMHSEIDTQVDRTSSLQETLSAVATRLGQMSDTQNDIFSFAMDVKLDTELASDHAKNADLELRAYESL